MTEERKQKLQEALDQVRDTYHDHIAAELENTTHSFRQVAEICGCSESTVYLVSRMRGCRKGKEGKDNG